MFSCVHELHWSDPSTFPQTTEGNPIPLIKHSLRTEAQMQFVTISCSPDFDYTSVLYADQRLLTKVNLPLKPIRCLRPPDHAHRLPAPS